MAGHSKWANIQFRKGAQDAKRGKLFTKLIREITIATRLGGSDPGANPRLRAAIDKANANNMPKDKTETAIKRGAGELDGQNIEEVRYEGYGPGGVAVMVDCMTDNRKRTVSEVRHAFSKCAGNLGTDGSVAYMFAKKGVISFDSGTSEDAVMEVAIDAGAEDVVGYEDGSLDVFTEPDEFEAVRDALLQAGLPPGQAEVTMYAANQSSVDLDNAQKMLRLLEILEDLDDVQNVYSNADFPAEVMAQLN